MVFRVVSLPPTISSNKLPRYWNGGMSLVSSPCASMETKSSPGFFSRSSFSLMKYSRHSSNSSRRCSIDSMMPPGCGIANVMSDHRVSFRRSSKGKSNKVASIMVVSSIDTVSTQSNGSSSGRLSNTEIVRSLINGSRLTRFLGATTPVTVFRCASCTGGSMAIKVEISSAPSGNGVPTGKPRVIPLAELKVCQSVSTCLMCS